MSAHLRANLWLLVLTLLLCSAAYPAVLWALGRVAFSHQAEGSLITGPDGKVIGSRLIAQPFSGAEYFQPRPSAVSYKADASGASNWGASNPLLRDRVARALGPIVKCGAKSSKKGQAVGPDIESWFAQQAPDFVARWASEHSTLAEQWIKDNPDAVASFLGKDVGAVKSAPRESAEAFWPSFVQRHSGTWPSVEDVKEPDGKTIKQIKPVKVGADVQAYLFDPWLQAHADADLEQVPADMVMASGSGLDPHITLKNARYQLKDHVAGEWAKRTGADEEAVSHEIEKLLEEKAEAPLGGLVGVKLVNVLEINQALPERLSRLQRPAR